MSYNSGVIVLVQFEITCPITRSLNCTPLSPITITKLVCFLSHRFTLVVVVVVVVVK